MKVTNEKVENRQAFLSIEVEPAEVEQSLEECYRSAAKKTDIPGFRKGKAPREVLERHLSKEHLREEALGDLIPKAYRRAIEEQKLEPIARPHIEIAQNDPLVFKAVVPLPPLVELGDYHSIQVTPQPAEVGEGDVDALIERLRHQSANWEPVERPVDFNDMVVVDIESNIEGKPFINQKGAQYLVAQNSSFPTPGFAEQIAGMKRDEEKEFKLQISPEHPKKEMAGKEVFFKVKVGEIKQESLPELDDEFAKGIDPELKTMDSLRERISADLKRRAEEKAEMEVQEQAMEVAADTAHVEYPPILIESEIDQLLSQRLRRWQRADDGLDEYLKSIGKTEEEVREELRPLAAKRTVWSLVLGEIADKEKIKVDKSEIDAEIEVTVKGVAENSRAELNKLLNTPRSRRSIEQTLLTRKTMRRLVEIAKGSNTSGETPEKEEGK